MDQSRISAGLIILFRKIFASKAYDRKQYERINSISSLIVIRKINPDSLIQGVWYTFNECRC
jgi:hypothetical protein